VEVVTQFTGVRCRRRLHRHHRFARTRLLRAEAILIIEFLRFVFGKYVHVFHVCIVAKVKIYLLSLLILVELAVMEKN